MPDQRPSNISPPQMHGSLQEMVVRTQALLGERIDQARETLRANEEKLARLQASESRVAALEAELQSVRKSAKDFQIQVRKLEAENRALHLHMTPLEKEKRAAVAQVARLREAMRRMQETAGLEVGRVVKTLLPNVRLGRLKRPSLAEKAALLVDGGIVDPDWYLRQHPDVASAGMDAGVHYVLHGAEEGRIPKPELNGNVKEI